MCVTVCVTAFHCIWPNYLPCGRLTFLSSHIYICHMYTVHDSVCDSVRDMYVTCTWPYFELSKTCVWRCAWQCVWLRFIACDLTIYPVTKLTFSAWQQSKPIWYLTHTIDICQPWHNPLHIGNQYIAQERALRQAECQRLYCSTGCVAINVDALKPWWRGQQTATSTFATIVPAPTSMTINWVYILMMRRGASLAWLARQIISQSHHCWLLLVHKTPLTSPNSPLLLMISSSSLLVPIAPLLTCLSNTLPSNITFLKCCFQVGGLAQYLSTFDQFSNDFLVDFCRWL